MLVAIVAIEDDRFWQHGALDVKGTLRALVNDLEHKPIQGGSTLEQQYVKNVLILQSLDDPAAQQAAAADTMSRKIDQLRMAVQVAHSMTKQDILAGYLNDSYYGSGAWGIEAAAETYFNTTAAKLTMVQAATLAGIVENPTQYNPMANPITSLERRNTVLARIAQTNPTTLTPPTRPSSSTEAGAAPRHRAERVHGGQRRERRLLLRRRDAHAAARPAARRPPPRPAPSCSPPAGSRSTPRVSEQDQAAATQAVNYVLPANSKTYNPAHNAATEVLIQPGTGEVLAIAEDRPYGTGKSETEVDYAVNTQYGGGAGVQTGSSSKLFTLITALDQGVPFGYQATVPGPTTVTGYYNCAGGSSTGRSTWRTPRARATSTYSLYTGTTQSINVFYAHLEQKVGLCNVVKTAVDLGLTRGDGKSLLARRQIPRATLPIPPTTTRRSPSAWLTSPRCPWPPRTRPRPRTAFTASRSCSPRS